VPNEKVAVYLTGEQWDLAYQILTHERTRTYYLGTSTAIRDEIIAAVLSAVQHSGFREERDKKAQANRDKYKNLRERHTAILRQAATMPEAECTFGYTDEQVTRVMGARLYDFRKWMRGQTGGICDGMEWSYEKNEYEKTGCGPHGYVTYRQDVERFLLGLPMVD